MLNKPLGTENFHPINNYYFLKICLHVRYACPCLSCRYRDNIIEQVYEQVYRSFGDWMSEVDCPSKVYHKVALNGAHC